MARNENDSTPRQRKRKKKSARGFRVGLLLVGCSFLLVLLVTCGVGILWATGIFGAFPMTAGAGTDKPRDRLVGQWDHIFPVIPGAKMSLDVRKDGTLTLTANAKGNLVVENGTWEVLSEKKDRLTIRLKWSSRPEPAEWDVELLANEEMRVNFLKSESAPVTYRRKR